MGTVKKWLARAAVLLLIPLFVLSVSAYSQETGSISISMKYGGRPVSGGTMTLYRAGEIWEDGPVLTPDFAHSEADLSSLSRDTAKALADHAKATGLKGTIRKISREGKVTFPDLEPGLYLLVQSKAAKGYYPADPFLVSVPLAIDGAYRYDVDASPKLSLEKKQPPDDRLPQTGQIHWPVPILAGLGLTLMAAGWGLRRKKR